MLVRLGSLISGNIELTPRPIARMAKSADAADLKSADRKRLWEFKSPSGHHRISRLTEEQPPMITGGYFAGG